MNNTRLLNALKTDGCWPSIRVELIEALHEADTIKRKAEDEIRTLEAWKAFHERDKLSTYGEFRLFVIEDGETHHIAAKSADEALSYHLQHEGESIEDPEVSELPANSPLLVRDIDDDFLQINTAAEWVASSVVHYVATTAY